MSLLRETNIDELKALIILIYYWGLYNVNHHPLNFLSADETGPPIYVATVCRNWMKFVLASISFDNKKN